MREPLDGPVLAVMPVDSVDEAIALANDSRLRPRAHRCGRPTATRALRIARELHAGMVWLNDHLPGPMCRAARGGRPPAAGSAGRSAQAGLRACAQEKLITWDPPRTRGLWWGPYDDATVRAARAVAKLRSGRESDRAGRRRARRSARVALALARGGRARWGAALPRADGCG